MVTMNIQNQIIGTVRHSYTFEQCNPADEQTSKYVHDAEVWATDEWDALKVVASECWKQCGWDTEKSCRLHIANNFCAIESNTGIKRK